MVEIKIQGFEGLYKITSDGKVFSVRRKKYLKGRKCTNGYLMVILRNKGKAKQIAIHRLVAYAYLENPEGLPMVNHKDENKTNNSVDNLEWCDNTYNIIYSQGKTYTFRGPTGVLYTIKGLNKFCREHKLQQAHMCNLAKGLLKSHKGWTLANTEQ